MCYRWNWGTRPFSNKVFIKNGREVDCNILFGIKGMQTTAISTSEDKREDSLSYGAADFINSNNKDDLKKSYWRFDLMLVTANAGTSA